MKKPQKKSLTYNRVTQIISFSFVSGTETYNLLLSFRLCLSPMFLFKSEVHDGTSLTASKNLNTRQAKPRTHQGTSLKTNES
jgi:hypothetical protein